MAMGYLNGKFINSSDPVLPIDERGHQFGDGVYEFIRVYNGRPFMMHQHMERLFKSSEAIRLNIGKTVKDIIAIVEDLIERSGQANCDVYMQVTRGIAPRDHLFPNVEASISMTVKPFKLISDDIRKVGATVKLLPDERWQNCWIKSLNLLPNILAKQAAFEVGALEAVLVRDGFITEGSSSNFFIVKNGEILTAPATNHILHGITRIAVKEIAMELGITLKEQAFTPDELLAADEAFLSSTGLEILPVTEVDEQKIGNGCPGTVTVTLYEEFLKRI
ncbi:amino acid aminotransferase [Domibacillus aminovorans]|uniref:D-alanine aminotransferase n=1 Tax=Domibacillus aminovorans TaxID=29332 RepID=A0A177KML4_9BACI|nr:D-amino-acid transaminase [Domibacillus aminovorans]OAH54367.1 amino acid aminotransferase [Domibacillus aminovorans]